MTTTVVHREPQALGVRGVLIGTGITLAIAAVVTVFSRDPLGGLLVGLAVLAVRQAVVTGPHRRGVVVTETETRRGWGRLPHADVRRVEVLGPTQLREAIKEGTSAVHSHAGLREGVRLEMVSPEGIERTVLIGARDPRALAEAIERHRSTARRPDLGAAPSTPPVSTRQGVDRLRAGVVLGLAVAADVVGVLAGTGLARLPLITAVVGALVLFTASRRVEVDAQRIRVGTARVSLLDVVSVRSVPSGEVAGIMLARTRGPLWGPPYTLLVVHAPDPLRGEASVASRTDGLGIPYPIEVPELHPSAVTPPER